MPGDYAWVLVLLFNEVEPWSGVVAPDMVTYAERRGETADLLSESVCVIDGASYAQYGSGTFDSPNVEPIPPDEQAPVVAHNAGGLTVPAGLLPAELSPHLRPIEHFNPKQRLRIEQRRLFKQRRAIETRSCEPVPSHQQSALSTTSVLEIA